MSPETGHTVSGVSGDPAYVVTSCVSAAVWGGVGAGAGRGGVYLLCSAVTFAHLTPVLGNFQLSLVWV